MPHVAFVPFTGLRVGSEEMLEFGMSLPGLQARGKTLGELPALGLLTLAGMLPDEWSCSYHPSASTDTLIEEICKTSPDIVAISALTASVEEAYRLCGQLSALNIRTVLGGLHATTMPDESLLHSDAVCIGDGEGVWAQILREVLDRSLRPVYQASKVFDFVLSPLPRFELLPKRSVPRWTLQTQRGCPWACEFCGASRLLGPPRFKPVDLLRRELNAIHSIDSTPWIELADDNTLAGRNNPRELLQMLGEFNIRYFTECDWRVGDWVISPIAISKSIATTILETFQLVRCRISAGYDERYGT